MSPVTVEVGLVETILNLFERDSTTLAQEARAWDRLAERIGAEGAGRGTGLGTRWLAAWTEVWEAPHWAYEEWDPEAFARWLQELLEKIGEVSGKGFAAGRSEGRMEVYEEEAERISEGRTD